MPQKNRKSSGKRNRLPQSTQLLSTRINMQADPVYTVTKRVIGLAALTTNPAFEVGVANGITLNAIPGYAELAGAFDSYRINTMEVEYLPRTTINDGNAVTNTGLLVSVVDRDDATTPTATNDLLEYPNAKVWNCTPAKADCLKHRFSPRIAIPAFQGAFTAYATPGPTWIDCAYPAVAHYGVKACSTVTSAAIIYDIMITVSISFRSSR